MAKVWIQSKKDSRNKWKKIDHDWKQSFVYFENLEKLDLEKNKLTKLESHSFQDLNKLKELNLGRNQIEEIEIYRDLKKLVV